MINMLGDISNANISLQERQQVSMICNPQYQQSLMLERMLNEARSRPTFVNMALPPPVPSFIERLRSACTQFQKWVLVPLFCEVWTPDHAARICWDLVSMFFILVQMLQVPLMLSFQLELEGGALIFNDIMNYFFLADILVNLNTGYYTRSDFVSSRYQVIKEYLKFWFWMDLASSFPYDEVIQRAQGDGEGVSERNSQLIKFIRFLKFLRVIRLLRALKLKKMIAKLQETMNIGNALENLLCLMKLVMLILCLAHWLACLAYVIATSVDDQTNTWITLYGIDNEDWYVKYITALYWSVTTMVTIGYGDVLPANDLERVYIIVCMVIASGVFGYATNSIILIFETRSPEQVELEAKFSVIRKYIRQRELPFDLQERIRNYMDWLGTAEYSARIRSHTLDSISLGLKNELETMLSFKILKQIIILRRSFSSELLSLVAFNLQDRVFGPDEFIVRVSQQHRDFNERCLYFIKGGQVSVRAPNGKELQVLEQGSTFGEIGFFTDLPRTAMVRTIEFANIICLRRGDFIELCRAKENDLQVYFRTKHHIEATMDYTLLAIRCYCCNTLGHVVKDCPKLHLRVDKEPVIDCQNDQLALEVPAPFHIPSKTFKHVRQRPSLMLPFLLAHHQVPLPPPRPQTIESEVKADQVEYLDQGANFDEYHPKCNLDTVLGAYNASIEKTLDQDRQERKNKLVRAKTQINKPLNMLQLIMFRRGQKRLLDVRMQREMRLDRLSQCQHQALRHSYTTFQEERRRQSSRQSPQRQSPQRNPRGSLLRNTESLLFRSS